MLLAMVCLPFICKSQKISADTSNIIYQSETLIITKLTNNTYLHTTFLETETFGKVACNGMIVVNKKEAVVFDTPADDLSTSELIKWMKKHLKCKIKAIIPTHFHEDCLGGLKEFDKNKVPSYASNKTIELAKGQNYTIPKIGFNDSLTLKVGDKKVIVKFFGEGHTKDNVVGYFPDDKVLFGGCLLKPLNAGKGYLGDANVSEWSETVEKIKNAYPDVKIVIPGHGNFGDQSLLDFTIQLFKNQ